MVRELGELKKQRRRYRASSAQRAEEKTDAGAVNISAEYMSAMMYGYSRLTSKLQVSELHRQSWGVHRGPSPTFSELGSRDLDFMVFCESSNLHKATRIAVKIFAFVTFPQTH